VVVFWLNACFIALTRLDSEVYEFICYS